MSHEDEDLLRGYDPGQVRMMGEMCIQVDNEDKVIGRISKKDCTRNIFSSVLYFNYKILIIFLFI